VKQVATRALRQLPPVLIGILVIMWLLLSQSIGVGSIALGISLAIALAWASVTLRPLRPRLHRPLAAFGLLGTVVLDIVRSNFAVARIVLGLIRGREVRAGFVEIALDLNDPHGLAGLAAIITSTPGTVWAGLSPDGKTLTLHVLDLQDEAALRSWIKTRYERPLMRIFE
jgi:multicomponent K+:H+ antiporter subunit E